MHAIFGRACRILPVLLLLLSIVVSGLATHALQTTPRTAAYERLLLRLEEAERGLERAEANFTRCIKALVQDRADGADALTKAMNKHAIDATDRALVDALRVMTMLEGELGQIANQSDGNWNANAKALESLALSNDGDLPGSLRNLLDRTGTPGEYFESRSEILKHASEAVVDWLDRLSSHGPLAAPDIADEGGSAETADAAGAASDPAAGIRVLGPSPVVRILHQDLPLAALLLDRIQVNCSLLEAVRIQWWAASRDMQIENASAETLPND